MSIDLVQLLTSLRQQAPFRRNIASERLDFTKDDDRGIKACDNYTLWIRSAVLLLHYSRRRYASEKTVVFWFTRFRSVEGYLVPGFSVAAQRGA